MSIFDFTIKPLNINEDETKYINIMNIGIFKIKLTKTKQNKYNVLLHNTTGIRMFDPLLIDNYHELYGEEGNCYLKVFESLDIAKQFAESMYKHVIEKVMIHFRSTMLDYLDKLEVDHHE